MTAGKRTEVCRNEVVMSWFASPVETGAWGDELTEDRSVPSLATAS